MAVRQADFESLKGLVTDLAKSQQETQQQLTQLMTQLAQVAAMAEAAEHHAPAPAPAPAQAQGPDPAPNVVVDPLDDVRRWRAFMTDSVSLEVLRQALSTWHVAAAPPQWRDELQGKTDVLMQWAVATSKRLSSGQAVQDSDWDVGATLLANLRVDAIAIRMGRDVRSARRAFAVTKGDTLEQVVAKLPPFRKAPRGKPGSGPRRCRRCHELHTGPWDTHKCPVEDHHFRAPQSDSIHA